MFVLDLHVHTVKGSSDSSLTVDDLITECHRIGLDGICLTEHSGGWLREDIEIEFHDSGLLAIGAIEVNTNLGHVLAIGIDQYTSGINNIEILRKAVDEEGGLLIAAHPMRNLFNNPPYNRNILFNDWKKPPKTVHDAATHELFEIVDLIEISNGANPQQENLFTSRVADFLGKGGTGGSDSHSREGIGSSVTVFDNPIKDRDDLVSNLIEGPFYVGQGLNKNTLKRFP